MEASPIPRRDFPHIWASILSAVTDEDLPALRATCRELKEYVDNLICEHVVIVLRPRRIYTAVGHISLPYAGNAELSARVCVLDMRKGEGGANQPIDLLGPEIAFPNVQVARVFDQESEQLIGRTIDRLQFSPVVPVLLSQITRPREMNMDQFRYAAFGAVIGDTVILPVPYELGLLEIDEFGLPPRDDGEVIVIFDERLDDAIRQEHSDEPNVDSEDRFSYRQLARELAEFLSYEDTKRVTIVNLPDQRRDEFRHKFEESVEDEVYHRECDGDDFAPVYDIMDEKMRYLSVDQWRNEVHDDLYELAWEMPALHRWTRK